MIATDIVPMAYPTALLGFFMFILASWLLTLIGYGNLNVTNSLHFVPRSVDYYEEERNIFSFIENSYVWPEFCLVNISQFIASRGSTSSKVSEIVLPVIGLSGALGSVIWYTIQKGSLWQFGWAFSGFLSMLIVPLFEIFQAPAFFVSYKVLITKRFIWTLFPFNKRKFIKEEHVIQLINKSEKLKGFFNINTSTYEISNPDYDDEISSVPAIPDAVAKSTGIFLEKGTSFVCIGERIRRFNKSYFRGPSKKRKSTIFETANYLLHVTGACFATVGITAATYLEQDKEIFPSMWITIAAAIIFLTVSELGRASGDPYWHPLALLPTWNPNRLSVTTRSVPIEKVNYFTALEEAVVEAAAADKTSPFANPTLFETPEAWVNKATGLGIGNMYVNHPKTYLTGISAIFCVPEIVVLITPALTILLIWISALYTTSYANY